MKKLSLVLALVLVLTCGVLAACGGDEDASSVAESSVAAESKAESSAAAESSEAVSSEAVSEDASSEAVSEDASSEDASSEAETSTPEAEKPEISGDNLAKGKPYTVSGSGVGYQNYTANLTDGNASSAMSYDNNWFAFYCNDGASAADLNAPNKVGYVIIDLGAATDVSAVRLNLINSSSAGVPAPKKVTVSLSSDGSSFGDAVSMPLDAVDGTAYWSEGAIEGNAQFVKVEFTLDGVFVFLNEIEVY